MNTRDKTDKFIFLANKRVNKAIKVLKLIGNLANKKNYSYSDEQVKKIIKALQKEVDSIRVVSEAPIKRIQCANKQKRTLSV